MTTTRGAGRGSAPRACPRRRRRRACGARRAGAARAAIDRRAARAEYAVPVCAGAGRHGRAARARAGERRREAARHPPRRLGRGVVALVSGDVAAAESSARPARRRDSRRATMVDPSSASGLPCRHRRRRSAPGTRRLECVRDRDGSVGLVRVRAARRAADPSRRRRRRLPRARRMRSCSRRGGPSCVAPHQTHLCVAEQEPVARLGLDPGVASTSVPRAVANSTPFVEPRSVMYQRSSRSSSRAWVFDTVPSSMATSWASGKSGIGGRTTAEDHDLGAQRDGGSRRRHERPLVCGERAMIVSSIDSSGISGRGCWADTEPRAERGHRHPARRRWRRRGPTSRGTPRARPSAIGTAPRAHRTRTDRGRRGDTRDRRRRRRVGRV